VPKFCRHNRLIQNCPICSREQAVEPRPLVSSSTPGREEPRPRVSRPASRRDRAALPGVRSGLRVRHLRVAADDGYRSPLVPGLRSSQEAERLALEVAFAATRLDRLQTDPPGLYLEVADRRGEVEERTWLAFLIAYLWPLEAVDPFAAITRARTRWSQAEALALGDVDAGPRTVYDRRRWAETVAAYRGWAQRAGSQRAAFSGDPAWSPERRFARVYERLALPGLSRAVRFELLTSLGALGVYELTAGRLELGGPDEVTLAAKRALGIGDPLLLERRAAELADACGVPLAALDLGFHNWERGERTTGGLGPGAQPDEALAARSLRALGL
jgi:hypothetical protein